MQRILDAAFDCVSGVGLGRTTVEDVARHAGLSRQTIYRYFPSKDVLILSLVLREEEKFLDGVRMAFATDPDLEEAVADGIEFCLRFAREHPLLDRLLATDSETLLPYLTIRSTPILMRARTTVTELIASRVGGATGVLNELVDVLVRVMVSYLLAPPERPVADVARDLARIVTVTLDDREAARP